MPCEIKTAIIFAAGYGMRMRPFTIHTPKALLQLWGRRIVEYNFDMVLEAGIKHIIINGHYLGEQIEEFVKKWRNDYPEIRLDYVYEPEALETGGAVLNNLAHIASDYFVTLNSDIVFIYKKNPILQLKSRLVSASPGILLLTEDLAIPKKDFSLYNNYLSYKEPKEYIFTGLSILHKNNFPDRKVRRFSLREIYSEKMQGAVLEGKWLHIGTPRQLMEAELYENI